MADIAKHTVKYDGKYFRPGQEIPGLKAAERKALLEAGAITASEPKRGGSAPSEETSASPDPDAIPADFPGAEALAKAGITTFAALDAVEDLTSIDGIGKATAEKIENALDALEAE